MMTDWWTMTRRPEIAALQKVANDFSDTSFKSFPFLIDSLSSSKYSENLQFLWLYKPSLCHCCLSFLIPLYQRLSQPRRHVCESMTKSPISRLDTDSIAQFFIENTNVGNQSHLEDSRSAYSL